MANQKIPRPKTQKEILLSNPVQDTYKNPETGETTGNPNRAFPEKIEQLKYLLEMIQQNLSHLV